MTTTPRLHGLPLVGSLLSFRRDRLAFLLDAARHGSIVRTRVGLASLVVVSAPELAQEVLVQQDDAFVKSIGLSVFARPLLGNGLLTSERELHRRQRRLMAPSFVQKRIAEYATEIAARTEAMLAGWAPGRAVGVVGEMNRLTLDIVGKTLFGAEVRGDAAEIGEALTLALEHIVATLRSPLPIPPGIPTPRNLRYKRTVERLDAVVYRLIRERRALGKDQGDVLSMLLLAQDEDDGGVMTDQQVRDEAMTLLLAGHETTANALAWTWYLLAQHPEARARLEAEVDAALGGRTPALADLASLPYARCVFKEAMRLYPPAFVVGRRAARDVTLGGHAVRKGEIVLVNIYGMHRQREYFRAPDRFDPDRFTPQAEKALPRHAYLPFSAGPRVCIGNHFALMEGHLVVATMAQRVRLAPEPGYRRVDPVPMITLRPAGPMPMEVTRRDAEARGRDAADGLRAHANGARARSLPS